MPETQPHPDAADYYDRRAPEYESIYQRDDPDRRAELETIARTIRALFEGRRVLEVACGTGYWTAIVAGVAEATTAIDASRGMLSEARRKRLPGDVVLIRGDAFALDRVPGEFDAGLANFWISHVPRARLAVFLAALHRRLGACAAVFLADNVELPGCGGDLIRKPGREDTFKLRRLDDGSEHAVLKNYFEPAELEAILSPGVRDLELQYGRFYWWASYVVA